MFFEDIPLGQKTVLGTYTFTEENIIAFAREFDPQPFHTDAEAARDLFYGGLVASGWHTAAVWMKLMMAHRRTAPETQDNYISPGLRDLRWHLPVRPGMTLTYTTQPSDKIDWPSRPALGLLESRNEARDADGKLYYSFVSRVLIARRPSG